MISPQLPAAAIGRDGFHGSQLPNGLTVLAGSECQYGSIVSPEDLVTVDLAKTHVHAGGALYLLVEARGDQIIWRGCRRLTAVPDGVAMDQTGNGDWKTLSKLPAGVRVVATVTQVYRPSPK